MSIESDFPNSRPAPNIATQADYAKLHASHDRLFAAAKETQEAIGNGECGPNASYYFHLLKAAIAAAEEIKP